MSTSRSRPPLRATLAGLAAALVVVALPTSASALWDDSVPLSGALTTGSLSIDSDTLIASSWTNSDGTEFDPATDRLASGSTVLATVDVPVTALGNNLVADLEVTGARIPPALTGADGVTVATESEPVRGTDGSGTGAKVVPLTLTVHTTTLPSGVHEIDLSLLTVTLTNGRGWSDTAELDAGRLAAGTFDWAGAGAMSMTFDVQNDTDHTVGFYLSNPTPGTTISWGVWGSWDGSGRWTERTTPARHGKNAFDYSDHLGGVTAATQTQVVITGAFEGFGSPEQDEDLIGWLTRVSSWSETGTRSLAHGFSHASRLQDVNQIPSTITDLSYTFAHAATTDQSPQGLSLSSWEDRTANVTTMTGMFAGSTGFQGEGVVEGWDTSSVTDMSSMFEGASSFTAPIDGWQTQNVTSMSRMFYGASAFGSDQHGHDLQRWDVVRVLHWDDFATGSQLTDEMIPEKFRSGAAPPVAEAPAQDAPAESAQVESDASVTTPEETGDDVAEGPAGSRDDPCGTSDPDHGDETTGDSVDESASEHDGSAFGVGGRDADESPAACADAEREPGAAEPAGPRDEPVPTTAVPTQDVAARTEEDDR